MSNNGEILFGIRMNVLAEEGNRTFLKKYLADTNLSLSVITGIIDNCMVNMHSCVPRTYKPIDFSKLATPESPEWQKSILSLIKSENGNNVIWFSSTAEAICYIESLDSK